MIQDSIRSVAVIGAGTMGQGIAQICAVAGFKVLLYDVQPELILNGINSIRKNLDTSVEKGKLTAEQKLAASTNIISVSDFRNLQVELVIEAVIEKLEVKQKIFSELEKINGKDCLLASNTSSIPITQIASVLKHQGRFAGLHFFNPAPVMKLVEVIKGASTNDDSITKLLAFSKALGKTAIQVKDSPGFVVNRVARHFYVESLKLLEENVADVESIDQLIRSTGFKMGPFELMDMIGVDTNFSVTSSMYNAFHQDSKFRPSRIQQQKVDAGHWEEKAEKVFMIIQTGKLKHILITAQRIGLVFLLFVQLNSCTPDLSDDAIPYQPFNDIVINLGLPAYSSLSTDQGFKYVSGGIKGLLIYRQSSSKYIVFERNCSFHPNDACSTINVHSSTLYIEDSCCSSTFRFPDGEPTGGPAWRPLRQYVTFLDGNELVITDDIVQ